MMTQERLNRCHRPIAQRIIVRGTLILDTPTCLGSGDADSPTDIALLRDSVSDCALLTGASIAGALRNYLREYQHGYGVEEQKGDRATRLFGGTRRDPDGEQSPLIINDAISSTIPTVELRDGVEIEAITGTAKPGHKYDLELLAAGTKFSLSFELLVEKDKNSAEQQALINDLAWALQGLEKGEIGIGMKKRRGFGRCHVEEWQLWSFNLEDAGDRTAWLNFEHWHTGLLPDRETYSSIATTLGVSLENEKDKRDRFLIHAEFKLVGSLLIRSGQDSTGRAPDVVHLKSHRPNESESQSVLSGTSLAGVLRHRAERIVKTLGSCSPIVDNLFGFVIGKQSQASRLVVHEKVIKDATDLVQNRIAIDRFTGGAYHGALFDEQPIFGGDETRVCIELELRNPNEYEIGLLLLLLKDLWTSDLPVGGESSIGRGRLKGIKADLIHHHPQNPQQWEIFEENGTLHIIDKADKGGSGESVRDTLERFVKALLAHLGKEVEV
ncbi:RAMP superfamily CRISPR-associated protein [Tychonema sp. LEGE 06208]|uniref:RAMP superfamily CRISPR-associated protein n=1 Tax=Tychonema sp. LEGE 06208 TaxID=1828663 RepID=UPI0030DB27EB